MPGKINNLCFLQSGAKINISDGSCPERVVTVTGSTDAIFTAFKLICAKFEEVSKDFWKLYFIIVLPYLNKIFVVQCHTIYLLQLIY